MRSGSFFSLPLAVWQQPQSPFTSQYESKKRRRVEEDTDDPDEVAGDTESQDEPVANTSNRSSIQHESQPSLNKPSAVLSPDEVRQYRIAGQPLDQPPPRGHFPHVAASDAKGATTTRNDLHHELAGLCPPILGPQIGARPATVRTQHLAVLTTILHRCLLEKDFIRAGRAWGMILRDEFGGHAIDIRSGNRWGIGAEIVLRRDAQTFQQIKYGALARGHDPDMKGPNRDGGTARPCFTRKGFEEAKAYYERLILQYPYRKTSPDTPNSLDFYPAMFGLWMYVVQEERDTSIRISETRSETSDMDISDSHEGWDRTHRSVEDIESSEQQYVVREKSRLKAWDEARVIASKMDDLMVSPPYSDSRELSRLRDMVELWIKDLGVQELHRSIVLDGSGWDAMSPDSRRLGWRPDN